MRKAIEALKFLSINLLTATMKLIDEEGYRGSYGTQETAFNKFFMTLNK